jgi:hypothetical protein
MALASVFRPFADGLLRKLVLAFQQDRDDKTLLADSKLTPEQVAIVAEYRRQLNDIRRVLLDALDVLAGSAPDQDERGKQLLADAPDIERSGNHAEKLLLLFRALEHFRRRKALAEQGHLPKTFMANVEQRYGAPPMAVQRLLIDEMANAMLQGPEQLEYFRFAATTKDALFFTGRAITKNQMLKDFLGLAIHCVAPEQLPALAAVRATDRPLLEVLDRGMRELRRAQQIEALRKLKPSDIADLRRLMDSASGRFRAGVSEGSAVNCWMEACRVAEIMPVFADALNKGRALLSQTVEDNALEETLATTVANLRRKFGEKVWLSVFAKGIEFTELVADPKNETKLNAIGNDAIEAFTLCKLREVLNLNDAMVQEFMTNFDSAIEEWGAKKRPAVMQELAGKGEEVDRAFVLCVTRWRDKFYGTARVKVIVRFLKAMSLP